MRTITQWGKTSTHPNGTADAIQVRDGGALASVRRDVNFIDGTNVTVTVADNVAADRADVTINAVPGGTAGGDLTGTYPNPTIANNAVSNANLRDSVGVSVIGRSANSTGDPADIAAASDGLALVRTAGALSWSAPGGDLAGAYPSPEVRQASKSFALAGDISYTLSANQNDWNPSGLADASVIRITSSSVYTITGLQGGSDGRIITLLNVGTANIILDSQSASSSAANRFAFSATINPDSGSVLIYDATSSRWRLVSSASGSAGFVIDIYDTPGTFTWTKPANAVRCEVLCIGAGAGGGSGRKAATLTARGGGAGGAGGGYTQGSFPASVFSATETVIVGAGGAGGAVQLVNSTNGNNGAGGGYSSFSIQLIGAPSGAGGGGATAAVAGGIADQVLSMYPGGAGGIGGFSTAAPGALSTLGGGGGGGGGGCDSANTRYNGRNGGQSLGPTGLQIAEGGGGSGNGVSGTDGQGAYSGQTWVGGTGGGGGAGGLGGVAGGNGGNGGVPGGGGGGGGGCDNSAVGSGKGGDGARGLVVVTTYLGV